jgi:hypothetical protein
MPLVAGFRTHVVSGRRAVRAPPCRYGDERDAHERLAFSTYRAKWPMIEVGKQRGRDRLFA